MTEQTATDPAAEPPVVQPATEGPYCRCTDPTCTKVTHDYRPSDDGTALGEMDEVLREFRSEHRPYDVGQVTLCTFDDEGWPCPTILLVAEIERLRALVIAAEQRGAERERELIVAALLAHDPVEWALAGQHAGSDAVQIARTASR